MEGQDSIGNADQRPPGPRLKDWDDTDDQASTETQQSRGVASNTATVHPIKSGENAALAVILTAPQLQTMKKLEEKTTPDKVGQSKLKDWLPPNYTHAISRSNSLHSQGVRVWNKRIQSGIDRDKAALLTRMEDNLRTGVAISSPKCSHTTVRKQAVADNLLVKESLTTGYDSFEKKSLSHKETSCIVSCCVSPIERNVLFSNSKPLSRTGTTWITDKHGSWQKEQVPISTGKESTLITPALDLVLPKANFSTFVSSDICTFTNQDKSCASIVDGSTMKTDQLLVEKVEKPTSSQKLNANGLSNLWANPGSNGNQESKELLNHFMHEVRSLANRSMEGLNDNQQKVFKIAVQDLINVVREMQLTNCKPRAPVGKHVACPTHPKPSFFVEDFPKAMVDKATEEVISRLPKPLVSRKQQLRHIDGISKLVEISTPCVWSNQKTIGIAGVQYSMGKKVYSYSEATAGSLTDDSDEIEVIEIIPPPGNPEQENLTMEIIPMNIRSEIMSELESVGWTDEELANLMNNETQND